MKRKKQYFGIIGFVLFATMISCSLPTFGIEASGIANNAELSDYTYVDDYDICNGETLSVDPEEPLLITGFVNEEQTSWSYEYVIPRDGYYVMSLSGLRDNTSVKAEVVDEWNNSIDISSKSQSFNTQEGEIYHIHVSQHRGNTDFTLYIGVQQPTIEIPDEYTRVNDQMFFNGQKNQYQYIAPYGGIYYIYSSCEDSNNKVKINIYSDGSFYSSDEVVSLKAEKEYIIEVQQSKGYGNYSLFIGVPQQEVEVSGYTTIIDRFQYPTQENVYWFTPPVTGVYKFSYSIENKSTFQAMALWDSNGVMIDDFGSGTLGVLISETGITLQKGETYALGVKNKNGVWGYEVKGYEIYIEYPEGALDTLAEKTIASNSSDSISENSTESKEPNEDANEEPEIETTSVNIDELLSQLELLQEILDENGIEYNSGH